MATEKRNEGVEEARNELESVREREIQRQGKRGEREA
jgi:hypothetical protein